MSVAVTTYPKRSVGANTSRYVAAHNPIIYKMLRNDFAVNNIQMNPGFSTTHPSVNVGAITALQQTIFGDIAVGDRVYLNASPYVGYYTVISTHITGSAYHIVIDTTFSGAAWSGYLNATDAIPNYWLETQVVRWIGGQWVEIGAPLQNYPDAAGNLKVDVQSVIQNQPLYFDEFAYDQINQKDEGLSGWFNIKWTEHWDGSSNSFTAVVPANRHFYVNSARQIGEVYGQNMGDCVPFVTTPATDAKFLSGFDRPIFFPGFPFDLSFIYSDAISSYACYRAEQKRYADGILSSVVTDQLNNSQAVYVNRLKLSENWPATKMVDVWIQIDDTVSGGGIPYVMPSLSTGTPYLPSVMIAAEPVYNPYE